tara:strand:- start:240 stop:455 length:216 start_codon:yes stop_codon:yes gene_type:complete
MIQENKQTRQKWWRFGEPVEKLTICLPTSLRDVVKGEARDRGISTSRLATDLFIKNFKGNPKIESLIDGKS